MLSHDLASDHDDPNLRSATTLSARLDHPPQPNLLRCHAMPNERAIVRERIVAALRDTERFFDSGKLLIGGVMLVTILGGIARDILWLSAISLLAFGSMLALLHFAGRRARMQGSEIRAAVLDAPERISAIEHYVTSSSSGAFPSHWLRFRVADQQLALRFEPGVIEALAPFLARVYVNAIITIPGCETRPSTP